MRAMPAETLEAPTPKLRTTVGNSSAVKMGRIALEQEMANLPTMARVTTIHEGASNQIKPINLAALNCIIAKPSQRESTKLTATKICHFVNADSWPQIN